MSYIKFNPDLFLESQELNRFQKFLGDEGFRKALLQNSLGFGIVNNSKGGNFTNFIVEQGTNIGTIKHSAGVAIDKNGNFITVDSADNIVVPSNDLWYWIKIKHAYSSLEVGTVSVDANGNLTGVGTKFLEVLRGAPNLPARIRFEGSAFNTVSYDVQEVSSDTNAILLGSFTAEANLKLVVIGTFTPDAVPPTDSLEIFQYDGCTMTLVQETVPNTAPSLLEDEEFTIARVKSNGTVLTIQDKRISIYKDKANFLLQNISAATNPCIGIEAIKFDAAATTKVDNLMFLSWGFRSTNWTIDSNINRVTLIGGLGGKFKSTTDFTDGDFDGWRIYTRSNVGAATFSGYHLIKSSAKVGDQINLILDSLDPVDFEAGTEVLVVPDVDSIEIKSTSASISSDLTTKRHTFPINVPYVMIPLAVLATTMTYTVEYRYKTFGNYRRFTLIPDDLSVGYLTEASFNSLGTVLPIDEQVRQTYSAGVVTLNMNPSAYSNFVSKIDLGDVFGVAHRTLNNGSPLIDLKVGVDRQYQVIEGTLTLTADSFINLNNDAAKNGNKFYLKFENITTLDGNALRIVQAYNNPGDFQLILEFDAFWLANAQDKNMFLECVYDGTTWVVYPDASVTPDLLSNVLNGALLADGSVSATGILKYNGDKTFTTASNEIPDVKTVEAFIDALKGTPPGTLDTLQELAAAIGNDPNFATTITGLLSLKVNITDIVDTLGSSSTTRPLSANQGRLLNNRTNQSVLYKNNGGDIDLSPAAQAPSKTYTPLLVNKSDLGDAAYNYKVAIIAVGSARHDTGGLDKVRWDLQVSTNGGGSYVTIKSVTNQLDDETYVPLVIVGSFDITTNNILVRLVGTNIEGSQNDFSNNCSIDVIVINTHN